MPKKNNICQKCGNIRTGSITVQKKLVCKKCQSEWRNTPKKRCKCCGQSKSKKDVKYTIRYMRYGCCKDCFLKINNYKKIQDGECINCKNVYGFKSINVVMGRKYCDRCYPILFKKSKIIAL